MPVETVPFKILRNGDFHAGDPADYEKVAGEWKATTRRNLRQRGDRGGQSHDRSRHPTR